MTLFWLISVNILWAWRTSRTMNRTMEVPYVLVFTQNRFYSKCIICDNYREESVFSWFVRWLSLILEKYISIKSRCQIWFSRKKTKTIDVNVNELLIHWISHAIYIFTEDKRINLRSINRFVCVSDKSRWP